MTEYNDEDIVRIINGLPRKTAKKKVVLPPITEHHKKDLLAYNDYLAGQGKTTNRRFEMIRFIRNFLIIDMENKKTNDITRKDIEKYLKKINDSIDIPQGGKFHYRLHLKTFLTFFYKYNDREFKDLDKLEELIGWFKVNQKTQDKKNRKTQKTIEYVTLDQVKKMLPRCSIYHSLRDQAILFCLWETGYRATELLSLNIGDIATNGEEWIFKKEDLRESVTLEYSKPFLKKWLEYHPKRADPNAPIWISEQSGKLTYDGLHYLLSQLGERSGFPGLRAHLFRDGFATFWATKVEPNLLAKMMGHTNINTVYKYYDKNKMQQIREHISQLRGKEVKKDVDFETIAEPKICTNCSHSNSQEAQFCNICGNPLTDKAKNAKDQKIETLKNELKGMNEKFEGVKELVTTTVSFINELKKAKMNTIFYSIDEKDNRVNWRPKEWFIENFGVDPTRLDIEDKEFNEHTDENGQQTKWFNEQDVLPFKKKIGISKWRKKKSIAK